MISLLMVVGTVLVLLVLWAFVIGDRYAGVEAFPDSVEHAHLRRLAEERLSALSWGAMRLTERERAVGVVADDGPAREFWRRYAVASGLVGEDPVAALRELRGLSGLLEAALTEADGLRIHTGNRVEGTGEEEA